MRDWNPSQIWLKCPKIRFLSLFSDFKSSYTDHVRFDYHYNLILTAAGLAPSVERLTTEREVAGSIPETGPTLGLLKWLRNKGIALDCKTVRIFAYSSTREQSNKRSGTRRVRLARFTRLRLLRHALPISLMILRKQPAVLQSSIVFTLQMARPSPGSDDHVNWRSRLQ